MLQIILTWYQEQEQCHNSVGAEQGTADSPPDQRNAVAHSVEVQHVPPHHQLLHDAFHHC